MRVIKKTVLKLLIFVFLVSLVSVPAPSQAETTVITNPYQNYTYNYKGNIHAHSTNSDGSDSPTVVGERYRDNGYDFYAITDHNFLTPDPGVSSILWLGKSAEISITANAAHMNVLSVNSIVTYSDPQTIIDDAVGQGGSVVLNHIERPDKLWSTEIIEDLTDLASLEIWNGWGLDSTGTWDDVLSEGHSIWGHAGDDSHSDSTRGNGYIVVNSDQVSPTAGDILSEFEAGNFYGSRGGDIEITLVSNTITATTTTGSKIRWIKRNGEVIKTTTGLTDDYIVDGDEQYVRVEILDGSNETIAWSQPISINTTLSSANELASRINKYTNTEGWDYWWDYAVPNNSTYRDWLFNDIIPSDPAIFSMFWDKAVPYGWTDDYYRDYFWDTLVPNRDVSSYYHDYFWDHAVPDSWAFKYYYSTFWDSAVPSKWVSSYYVGKLWDSAIPNKWASKFYFTNFWDKFVPNRWSQNYYRNSFWNYAVPEDWASSYYASTLNINAIPNRWASSYYYDH